MTRIIEAFTNLRDVNVTPSAEDGMIVFGCVLGVMLIICVAGLKWAMRDE